MILHARLHLVERANKDASSEEVTLRIFAVQFITQGLQELTGCVKDRKHFLNTPYYAIIITKWLVNFENIKDVSNWKSYKLTHLCYVIWTSGCIT